MSSRTGNRPSAAAGEQRFGDQSKRSIAPGVVSEVTFQRLMSFDPGPVDGNAAELFSSAGLLDVVRREVGYKLLDQLDGRGPVTNAASTLAPEGVVRAAHGLFARRLLFAGRGDELRCLGGALEANLGVDDVEPFSVSRRVLAAGASSRRAAQEVVCHIVTMAESEHLLDGLLGRLTNDALLRQALAGHGELLVFDRESQMLVKITDAHELPRRAFCSIWAFPVDLVEGQIGEALVAGAELLQFDGFATDEHGVFDWTKQPRQAVRSRGAVRAPLGAKGRTKADIRLVREQIRVAESNGRPLDDAFVDHVVSSRTAPIGEPESVTRRKVKAIVKAHVAIHHS